MQSMLVALLSEGFHKRSVPLTTLVRLLSANPARLYGLDDRKGALKAGLDADLVVVDVDKTWTLSADQLFYKNKHSAYVDREFKGQVQQTFVRGQLVYENGNIVAPAGYGKLLRRSHPYSYMK
jgi:allantoinase